MPNLGQRGLELGRSVNIDERRDGDSFFTPTLDFFLSDFPLALELRRIGPLQSLATVD